MRNSFLGGWPGAGAFSDDGAVALGLEIGGANEGPSDASRSKAEVKAVFSLLAGLMDGGALGDEREARRALKSAPSTTGVVFSPSA